MDIGFYEDITVGLRFVSRARTITESDIVSFAGMTGDWHPIHTDAEFSANSPFGQRIAHGMLILSLGVSLLFQDDGSENRLLSAAVIAVAGLNKTRFISPVFIGDTLHVEAEVKEISPVRDGKGIVEILLRILDQHDKSRISSRIRLLIRSKT